MKYILLICPDEEFPGAPPADVAAATDAWVKEMEDSGIRLIGDRLRPAEETTSVRRRRGKVVTTDGPFAEAKEQFGGFDVIECRDLDQAIEVAAKHPVTNFGRVEIRPFWVD
jgi:hypothetical protein